MIDKTLDLEIKRRIAAPRAKIWQAWTDPELIVQWWAPRPWKTELRAFDMQPGGAFEFLMYGPDGSTSDSPGSFLQVIPQEKIVFTTMMTAGWRPATSWLPMTAIFTMADDGDATLYRAVVMHADAETCKKHEDMGFYDGWGTCMTQLEEVAASL